MTPMVRISWKLLVLCLVSISGVVGVVQFVHREQNLIVFASNREILDVQMGIARPEPPQFHNNTACQSFQSQPANAGTVPSTPSWRPPPTWREHTGAFLGWSPQDTHLLDNHNGQTRLWNVDSRTVVYTTSEKVDLHMWSPNDRYLALILAGNTPTLRLLPLDTLNITNFPLPTTPVRYTTAALWSPDMRSMALYYTDVASNKWLDVYSMDGSKTVQDIAKRLYGEHNTKQYIHWSADSKALHFWQNMYDHYRLSAYDLETGTTREITRTARDPIYPSDNNHTAAVYYDNSDGTYSTELIDMATLTKTPLVAHADDLGDPAFHQSWVAAVYDTNRGAARDLRLVWIHLDGSARGEYGDPAYVDIRHLDWSLRGDKAVFVGIYPDNTYDLVVVDLLTGEADVIFEHAPDIVFVTHRSESRAWRSYAYTDTSEQWHLVGLSAELVPLFRLKTDVYIHRVQEVISPDGTHTVFKLHGEYPKRYMALGRTDVMTPRIVQEGLSRDHLPAWSPNGELVMVQEETTTGSYPYEMVFYRPDGDVIFRYPVGYGTWWACD